MHKTHCQPVRFICVKDHDPSFGCCGTVFGCLNGNSVFGHFFYSVPGLCIGMRVELWSRCLFLSSFTRAVEKMRIYGH